MQKVNRGCPRCFSRCYTMINRYLAYRICCAVLVESGYRGIPSFDDCARLILPAPRVWRPWTPVCMWKDFPLNPSEALHTIRRAGMICTRVRFRNVAEGQPIMTQKWLLSLAHQLEGRALHQTSTNHSCCANLPARTWAGDWDMYAGGMKVACDGHARALCEMQQWMAVFCHTTGAQGEQRRV